MPISYVAALFSLSGIIFNIRKNPICWFLFMASDSLWLYYFGATKLYTWSYKRHGKKDKNDL
jgi:nicotinamide riboside transporter PnuC